MVQGSIFVQNNLTDMKISDNLQETYRRYVGEI